jgi:hypothetical protein
MRPRKRPACDGEEGNRTPRAPPRHLAVYELESPADKQVAANPTPWTQRVGPQAVATTFTRNVYTMIHPRTVTPSIAASGIEG